MTPPNYQNSSTTVLQDTDRGKMLHEGLLAKIKISDLQEDMNKQMNLAEDLERKVSKAERKVINIDEKVNKETGIWRKKQKCGK